MVAARVTVVEQRRSLVAQRDFERPAIAVERIEGRVGNEALETNCPGGRGVVEGRQRGRGARAARQRRREAALRLLAVRSPAARRRDRERAPADAGLREPELTELPVGAGDGLPVDAERAREIADGGQPCAGRNTSRLDAAPQVVDELAGHRRRAGTALQRDDHGPTVTRMIALVKQANMAPARPSIGPQPVKAATASRASAAAA